MSNCDKQLVLTSKCIAPRITWNQSLDIFVTKTKSLRSYILHFTRTPSHMNLPNSICYLDFDNSAQCCHN